MEKKFLKGSEAVAEAAVRAGCRFFAGYPITPQNELPEYMSARLPQVGGHFVQGESEVSSINMLYGASSVGTRCMTSSSGPGLSLKAEGLSCAIGAKLPLVIAIMSRGGPGQGEIFPAQQDYLFAVKAPGHGGFKCFVLAPSTGQEAVDLTYRAFDYADKYRTGVIVLGDGVIANTMENISMPPMRDLSSLPAHNDWKATTKGPNGERRWITSYVPGPERLEAENLKMAAMYELWKETEALHEEFLLDDAEIVICSYGSSARICKETIMNLRDEGIKAGMIRPITLHPFPEKPFEKLDYNKVKKIICIEMSNPGQLIEDVKLCVARRCEVSHFGRSGGVIISPEDIYKAVKERTGR